MLKKMFQKWFPIFQNDLEARLLLFLTCGSGSAPKKKFVLANIVWLPILKREE